MSEAKKVGTWWDLPWYRKIIRWLRYIPFSYTKAIVFVYPFWKANKDDLSFKIAWIILLSVGSCKLDKFYRIDTKEL